MSENAEVNPAGESPQPPAEDKSANDRIRLLEAKNAELIVEKQKFPPNLTVAIARIMK